MSAVHWLFMIIICKNLYAFNGEDVCSLEDFDNCGISTENTRYLFYDVNQPEGFNLRRDVYMRLAIFIHRIHGENWKLILPPWPHLYHWRTKLINQDQLSWQNFFEVSSLKQFAPVLEMYEFFEEHGRKPIEIDNVLILQHYKDAFKTEDWSWSDKWSFEDCNTRMSYEKSRDTYNGLFWGYSNISARNVGCISFQGGASVLGDLLKNTKGRYIMLDHAEVILHENFGDVEYWRCRKSMKFANELRDEAKYFMKYVLNSTAFEESKMKKKKNARNMKGGPYLCIHLRRRDFILGRSNEIPTIKFAAKQISDTLLTFNISTVFIATDAPQEEIDDLKKLLQRFSVLQYKSDAEAINKYRDGGIAIIDQIICSYASYFIGSYESTFSFRIQEEREILGFPEDTTFNRFCGTNKDCVQPSKWKIQH